MDKFLAFGASFDWVTPLVDLYKDLNNGPHHDFYIDRYAGWIAGKHPAATQTAWRSAVGFIIHIQTI